MWGGKTFYSPRIIFFPSRDDLIILSSEEKFPVEAKQKEIFSHENNVSNLVLEKLVWVGCWPFIGLDVEYMLIAIEVTRKH